MAFANRNPMWQAALAASLLVNVLLLLLWLRALNAAPDVTPPAGGETIVMVVTATPNPQVARPSPTQPPSETPVPAPSATLAPIETATPTQTATSIATDTPSPTPTPTVTQAPPTTTPPPWLAYVNRFRDEGGLPPLLDDSAWSLGSEAHSRYTVKTDFISHSQDTSSPWYTQSGLDAARNGNLAATIWYEAPPEWAIDYWISAPFHALPMLDPQLESVGFGWYREQDGGVVFAANMDILRGLDQDEVDITYPVMFPRDGGVTWVRQSVLYEYPDPLTACPGFVKPTGPPVILQVGTGDGVPVIGGSSFRAGERVLDHCTFGETTYTNPDAAAQQSGRRILDVRDAIVLIPRAPLQPGETYTASIVVDGQQTSWSFSAVAAP